MDNESLKAKIAQWVPDAEFEETGTSKAQLLNAIITPDKLLEVAEKLRNEDGMKYGFMYCLTCVDFPEHFMMVYHLRSSETWNELVLKVKIEDKEKPEVETLCHIWRTAEYHEREVYDLFGVVFKNHPDLRRILLDEEWEG